MADPAKRAEILAVARRHDSARPLAVQFAGANAHTAALRLGMAGPLTQQASQSQSSSESSGSSVGSSSSSSSSDGTFDSMDSWFRQSQATSASASSLEDARNVPVGKVPVAPKPAFKTVTRRDVQLLFAPRIAAPTGPSPSRPPAGGRLPAEIETETIEDSQDSSAAVSRKRAASTSRPREDVPKATDAVAKVTGDSATPSITQDVRSKDKPSTTTTAPAPASPERTSHRESRAKEKEDKVESRGRSGGRRGSDGKGAGDAADA